MDRILDLILEYVSPTILWGVFAFLVFIFFIANSALSYHWKNYSINKTRGAKIMRLFNVVSLALLGIILISAIVYSL